MVQADLYPQIVYNLSGLFTMKPLIAAAKAMFGSLDATARETLLHTCWKYEAIVSLVELETDDGQTGAWPEGHYPPFINHHHVGGQWVASGWPVGHQSPATMVTTVFPLLVPLQVIKK